MARQTVNYFGVAGKLNLSASLFLSWAVLLATLVALPARAQL
jgi:hypothetical protein